MNPDCSRPQWTRIEEALTGFRGMLYRNRRRALWPNNIPTSTRSREIDLIYG